MNKKFLKLFKIILLGPMLPILSIPTGEGQEGEEGQEGQEGGENNNNAGEDNPDNDKTDNEEAKEDSKNFTQKDIDKIVAKRIKQQEKKIREEYEAEKKKANMTEIEKANLERDEARKKIEQLEHQNNQNTIKNEVFRVAAQMNAIDFEAVYQLLDKENISVENGKATGVKEAVEDLLNEKKFLIKTIGTTGHEQNNKNIPNKNKAFNDMIRSAWRR